MMRAGAVGNNSNRTAAELPSVERWAGAVGNSLNLTTAKVPSVKRGAVAILHNIRSVHNVGSMFRTADGAGIKKLYLVGYTPTPLNELGRARTDIAKTALGAERIVPWEYVSRIAPLIARLKREGYTVVAVEQSKRSADYRKFRTKRPVALVFGNEVRGLSSAILKKCDASIEIPMRGKKESLNVAVTFGIIAYVVSQ